MKSFVLRFVTTAAIVLSPVAIAAPANAAPATSSSVSTTSTTVHPDSYGNLICSGNGVMCIQRITSVDDSGMAKVEAWANTITWHGWFTLSRNGNRIRNSPTKTWTAGGAGWIQNLASGGGWSISAWQNPTAPIAEISFGIS
jgi:hypothetical protein